MSDDKPDEIDLMNIVEVLKKRKWFIVAGTFSCMIIAGLVSFLMPKIYEAKAYLMVTSPKYQVEFATKEGSKISTPLFENISTETYSKMILNENTARIVITKLGLDNPINQNLFGPKYSIEKILQKIKVEYPRNTNLIILKAQDTSRERAAQICNAWASAFIEKNEEVLLKETGNTYDFVMGQLEKVKKTLKDAEEELENFQKTNKIDLLKGQIFGRIEQIVKYESKYDDLVRSLIVEKARYRELSVQIKKEERTIPVDKGLIGKEEINPLYVGLSSRTADTTVNIESLKAEILQLKENIQNLNQDVGRLKKQLAEQELLQTRLTRNVDTAKSTFDILAKKGEETKISSSIKAATIQVSFPAVVPDVPIRPRKMLNISLSGAVGLLLAIILAFVLEFLEKNKRVADRSI